ncbi:MAG: hypothetical protein H6624_03195 [Bdellovibrionaceae bacterium]|nr:hypothetical protein [Bdellovibrionales bacterium]MCB9083320.1 hypothetical protein [Pseudobdellovibrionaceae bacterium]
MKKTNLIPKNSWMIVLLATIGLSLPLVFQNCGEGFSVRGFDTVTMAYGGVFRKDCLEREDVDSCLYFKNPVSQKGQPVAADEMAGLQLLAVQLKDLDGSGYLKNDSFEVYSAQHGRAQAGDQSWRFRYGTTGAEGLPQVMAYYWAQTSLAEIENRLNGPSALAGKNLSIITEAGYTGFSVAESKIFLAQGSRQVDNAAWSADVLIHLLMEAHIYYSSAGAAYDLTGDTNHQDCGPQDGPVFQLECCTSQNGCSRALTAGLADFWVARMFPDAPTLGESLSQNVNGLTHCGQSRHLEYMAGMTAAAAYGACDSVGYPGQVYTMGSLMASIWFEIWKEARAADSAWEVEALFLESQKYITGQDDFVSFLGKIRQADGRMFNGKWSARFEAEFAKRGL